MIGIGKWSLDVAIPFLKVSPVLTIGNENNEYTFTIDVSGFGASPAVNLISVEEVMPNKLKVTHTIPMITNGALEAELVFDGMYCKGTLEIPMLGKVTVKGVKVG
ncbi:MAG: hypothetical protein PUD72_04775 [Oscillospiraceae bacterium]|nr:hypothetical protein [Oscillospiraceae bacterium]